MLLRQMGVVVVVVGAVGGGWEGLTQGVGEEEGGVRTSSMGPTGGRAAPSRMGGRGG